jgi:hypothetical protein
VGKLAFIAIWLGILLVFVWLVDWYPPPLLRPVTVALLVFGGTLAVARIANGLRHLWRKHPTSEDRLP